MTIKVFWQDPYLTELETTGEIGAIRLKRINPGKGIERIEIFAQDQFLNITEEKWLLKISLSS